MANISVSDQLQATASVSISDTSPLALAQLKNLDFARLPIVGDFAKPIDQFTLDNVELGIGLATPSASIGESLAISSGLKAALSIYTPKHKNLFGDDDFAPALAIHPNECWAGLCLKATLQETLAAKSASGFGLSLTTGETLAVTTFVHFPYPSAPMPAFKEGLAQLLEGFSVPGTPAQMRALPLGIAHAIEATGSVSLGASYSVPLTVSPFATLGMPFNLALNVGPSVAASIKGAVTLQGSFIVRTYRSSSTKVVIGLYKKHESTLSATLTASAGVGLEIGKTDILGKVLGAVIPGADLNGLHLDEEQKKDLSEGLKQCANESIAIALNACCTASDSDEAAVIYELDLSQGDSALTDAAIAAALHGDWSPFESLPNATPIRHILRELAERNHKLNINLLGLYNATSITDYLNSTTVLQDEHGQISLVDKVAAKSLSAGTTPYAAKADKLRTVLARDFIATATYGACTGKLGVAAFTVNQSFLEYHAKASTGNLKSQIALAKIFGFSLNAELDSLVSSRTAFTQNKFYLDAVYDLACVYRLFYQDVHAHTPYLKETLDSIGRQAKRDLLDPSAPNSMPRLVALRNDDTWKAMNECGNVTRFGLIPSLSRLQSTALGAISADWTDIRSWSDAMLSIAPALSALLTAVDQAKSPNPQADPAFLAAHKKLEGVLKQLSENTKSAFGDGWPLAVMYRVASASSGAQTKPEVKMDISLNGKSQSQNSGQLAKTQSGAA
jgi:hypothetical protein